MPYATKEAACSTFLLIPGMMVMIAGRLLYLLNSGFQPDLFLAIIAESMFWGGGLAVVVGVILFVKGVPETKKARRILEIVLEKKEVAISEISTRPGSAQSIFVR
jgi:prolipoprotein diacylglyceryltransferase